ncbi:MAG: BspA family leucine-rich repeat surface protein [Lactococcus hircilactis]
MGKYQSKHDVKQTNFRTWKSGKSWLYAAGAFIVLASVVGAKTEISVKADSVTTAPTSTVASPAASTNTTESSTADNPSSNSVSQSSMSSSQAVSVANSANFDSSDSPSSSSAASSSHETSQSSSETNTVENSNSSEKNQDTTSTSNNINLSTASSSSAIGTSPNNSSTQAIADKSSTLAVSNQSENSMTSTTSATYDVSSYVDSTKLNEGTTASGAEVTGVHATVSWGKQVIRAGNSIIEQGEVWAPSQNFLGCTDSDGNSVPWSDKIQVSGSVDFDTPGTYNVEYGFTDPKTKNLAYTSASIIVQPEIVNGSINGGYIDKTKSVVASGYMRDPDTADSSKIGTDGTASWTLDNQGNLSISAGKVGNNAVSNYGIGNNGSPVSRYPDLPFYTEKVTRDIVKSITLTGPLQLNNYGYDLFSNFQNLTTINGLNNLSLSSNITSISGLFQNDPLLKSIDLSSLDTSNITDMSGLFFGDASLSSVNLKGLNTKNVTDMSRMFSECYSLQNIDVSGFDTSNVISMSSMFAQDWEYSLTNHALTNIIGLNHFNTKKVTDFSWMFAGDSALTQLDLSNFDMTSAKSTSTDSQGNTTYTVGSMLSGLTSLKQLSLGENTVIQGSDLPNPNVSQDGTYTGAWQNVGKGTLTQPNGKYALSSAQLIGSGVVWYDENNNSHTLAYSSYDGKTMSGTYVWQPSKASSVLSNTSGVVATGNMGLGGTATWTFYKDGTLEISSGTIGAFNYDVKNNPIINPLWGSYSNQIKTIIFDGYTNVNPNPITAPAIPNGDVVGNAVERASDWLTDKTGNIPVIGGAFDFLGNAASAWAGTYDESSTGSIGSSLAGLFAGLPQLTSIQGLTNLDTVNVTDMTDLFNGDGNLLSVDVSKFDTSMVTNMQNMFANNPNLQFINGLSHFNTSNVSSFSGMFAEDPALSQIDISSFDMFSSIDNLATNKSIASQATELMDSGNVLPDSENMYELGITFDPDDEVYNGVYQIIHDLTGLDIQVNTHVVVNYATKSSIELVISSIKLFFDDQTESLNKGIDADYNQISVLESAENQDSHLNFSSQIESYEDDIDAKDKQIEKISNELAPFQGSVGFTPVYTSGNDNILTDDLPNVLKVGGANVLGNANLSDLNNTTDSSYTGNWQSVGTGTKIQPNGADIVSSKDLMTEFNGVTGDGTSATYVWQPANYSITAQDLRVPVGAPWHITDNLKIADLGGKTNIYLNDQPLEPTNLYWFTDTWDQGLSLGGTLGANEIPTQDIYDHLTTVPGDYSIIYGVDGERMTHSIDVNVVVQGKGTYSNTADKSDNGNVIWRLGSGVNDYNSSIFVGTYTGTNGKKGIINLNLAENGDLTTGEGNVSGYYSGTDGNGTISGTYNSGILNHLIFTPWKVTLTSKNSTLTVGADWNPIDNLKTATDPSGNDLMVNNSYIVPKDIHDDFYEEYYLNDDTFPGAWGTQAVVYNSAGKIVAQDVANANGGTDFDKTFLNTAGTYKVVYQLSVRNADASITTYSTTATLNVVNPQSTNTGTSSNSDTSSSETDNANSSSSANSSGTGSSNTSSASTNSAGSSNASSANSSSAGSSSTSSASTSSAGSSSTTSASTNSTGSSNASSANTSSAGSSNTSSAITSNAGSSNTSSANTSSAGSSSTSSASTSNAGSSSTTSANTSSAGSSNASSASTNSAGSLNTSSASTNSAGASNTSSANTSSAGSSSTSSANTSSAGSSNASMPPSEPAGQTTTTNWMTVTTTGTGTNAGIVLNAKNLIFPAGTAWSAVKSYISGTDKGKTIDFNQLKIISNDVNPNVPGIYHITFCYGDPVTITATVTVYSSSSKMGNNRPTTGQTLKNTTSVKTMAYAPTKPSPVATQMNTTKNLPTTGDKSDESLLVLGMGLLAMTTFTFLYSGFKRKNRNQ